MKMDRLPLLFTFKEKVYGDGFLADTAAHGRVLEVRDLEAEGKVWMYGVQPGGIAASGEDDSEAREEFKKTYRAVLFDIASEETTFKGFKREVETFFNEVCRPVEKDWLDAVKEVRKKNYEEEGLHKKRAEKTAMKVTVTEVYLTPENNTVDTEYEDTEYELPEAA